MSQPTLHAPNPDVLPGLRADPRSDAPILPDNPRFHCPHCQADTPFNPYHVFAADGADVPEHKSFDKASRALTSKGSWQRDFYCQGCGRAVRVVYAACEFAMSSYFYIPQQVLVGAPRR